MTRLPGVAGPGGLTSDEVDERRRRGQLNVIPDRCSRSRGEIVRANLFTRFNAIITVLAVVVLVAGDPLDTVFGVIMMLNIGIGVTQELRAKRTLDRLRIYTVPTVTALRDGHEIEVPTGDLVLDDVIRLDAGDQVPVDALVTASAGLEVDESALTGEADPVAKHPGDEVLSGSAVVAGSASVTALRVGEEAWIHRLVVQAKEFSLTNSELRRGVDRILSLVSWILLPLAGLLLWSQLRADGATADGLVAAVAGVVGLVPQGLVLLVSLAMAVAIVRLAGNHVVVQELYAVEGLARIDVLCVDKTGTLTTGQLAVEAIEAIGCTMADLREALAELAAAEPSPTATMRVMAGSLDRAPGWQVVSQVVFSSARKWSGTSFAGHGSWLIGAPEILLDAVTDPAETVRRRIDGLTGDAKRVLLVARSPTALDPEGPLPAQVAVAGLVVLDEELRADAAETMAYFRRQNVTIKIISGDNPQTVSAVARRLGVEGSENSVDMRSAEGPLDTVVEWATVFGRVLPEQKRDLVDALHRTGHVVAMTGDGVNDIPALKRADIGIAMDTATPATKAVSQLVLLDGRFDRLPAVVAEGRRVIANMERVSSLFVTKTVYAAVFALAIGLSGVSFPFLPRHLSLVSELTIGIPAFILSFRGSDARSRPGYLQRVLVFAVPAGLAAATVTLGMYWLARSRLVEASLGEARSASTFSLVLMGFWVLYRLMRPVDRFDTILLTAMIALAAVVMSVSTTRDLYALRFPDVSDVLLTAGLTAASIALLELTLRWIGPWFERHGPTAGEGGPPPVDG